MWGNKFIHDAKKLIALTQKEKQEYIEMGASEKQISIVPNGISIPDLVDEKKEEFILEKYGIKPEEKIILYVGRIHKVKGLDILIKAYKKVDNIKNTKLIIIGADEGYLYTIKHLIKKLNLGKKLKILGYVEEDEKYVFLKRADIFCLTSYKEGLPISVLEACANGTPVIISRECNIPEVEQYNCGFITSNDPTEVAEKIDFLLKEESERKKMSNNCRKMVTEVFSWDSIVEKLESLYENVRKKS